MPLLPATAINGSVLRDAMGFKFADAPGQTDYQFVGDEMKKLIQADVKQGADPAAVVTPDLVLRGMAGLRVVDASVMPTLVSANPNAATLMIAEKASEWIVRAAGQRA